MADKTDPTIEEGLQPLTLSIDWDLFGSYLDDSDLTDDQKREFIESLWSIVVGFVDLGLHRRNRGGSSYKGKSAPLKSRSMAFSIVWWKPTLRRRSKPMNGRLRHWSNRSWRHKISSKMGSHRRPLSVMC